MAVEITFHVNSSKGTLSIKREVDDYSKADEVKKDALENGLSKDFKEGDIDIDAYFPPHSIIQIDLVSLDK